MVMFMEDEIKKQLMKLLKKAVKKNEVPVAAIKIYKNRIISKSFNRREKKNNVLGHAEIKCIQKAAKKLKAWKLNECTLYVTLKPCSMCEKIIQESRISNVIYLIDKPQEKKEYKNTKYQKYNCDEKYQNEIKSIMNVFFKKMR